VQTRLCHCRCHCQHQARAYGHIAWQPCARHFETLECRHPLECARESERRPPGREIAAKNVYGMEFVLSRLHLELEVTCERECRIVRPHTVANVPERQWTRMSRCWTARGVP
jgi:hypothetical protein